VWRALKRLGVTLKKRMARPVCKQCSATSLSSLRQRIRPEGVALAKMEIRASYAGVIAAALNSSPRRRTTQTIRASLFANATTAAFL
jgi:hypothetical protein